MGLRKYMNSAQIWRLAFGLEKSEGEMPCETTACEGRWRMYCLPLLMFAARHTWLSPAAWAARPEHVRFHAVPEQAHLSHARRDTGHYPDRYRSLLAELENVRPGTLYLVAAGMLSKIYCDVVRGAGGVAVDIGSVADLWAGVRSRMMFSNEELERWRIVIR